jgi:hypothetical protein
VVDVNLLEDPDTPFPAGEVNALQCDIIENVVDVAAAVQGRDGFSVFHVIHQQLARFAAADEQSMARLVQCHGEIRCCFFHCPFRDDLVLISIHDGDLSCGGDVDEDAIALGFKLKRFGMTVQLDVGDAGCFHWIDDRQSAAAIADVKAIGSAVYADIVRIILQIDLSCWSMIGPSEHTHRSITGVCHV